MKPFLKVAAICAALVVSFVLWIGFLMAADEAYAEAIGRYD